MTRLRSLAALVSVTCAIAVLGAPGAASATSTQDLSTRPGITDTSESVDRQVPNVHVPNVNSHLCLTIAGGSRANNAPAVQYNCDRHPSRYWARIGPRNGNFKLKNENSGLCLTIAGGSTGNNVRAVQYNCDGHRSRYWRLVDAAGPGVQIRNLNSNRCLTIAGGSSANNAPVVQYTCDGHPSRRWQL